MTIGYGFQHLNEADIAKKTTERAIEKARTIEKARKRLKQWMNEVDRRYLGKRSLKVSEVARATGISTKTVRDLDAKGVIKSVRDCNGCRHFDTSVVPFLLARYWPKTIPVQPKKEQSGPRARDFTRQEILDILQYGSTLKQGKEIMEEIETVGKEEALRALREV